MTTCVRRFTITRGIDNTFTFIIKQDGSTDPMVISGGDSFTAYLKKLEDDSVAYTTSLSIEDAPNGKVSLTIPSSETTSLLYEKGGKADRYYAKPMYSLLIDCDTSNNGEFLVRVPEVYVD